MATVCILHSDVPAHAPRDEQDVFDQVEAVSAALGRLGFEAAAIPLTFDMAATATRVRAAAAVCVFNLVETVEGRGCWIHLGPAFVEWMGLPCTGASSDAMYQTSNKLVAKRVLAGAGITTPGWVEADGTVGGRLEPGAAVIVKSIWEHASVGMDDDAVMPAADLGACREELARRRDRLGGAGFAEQYIEGREFNLALLAGGVGGGVDVLPPAEIVFDAYPAWKPRIVGYRAKWEAESFEYAHTVRRGAFGPEDDALLERMRAVARRAWSLFGLSGYARVDFRVDAAGTPWVLEVNANPCLSPDAGFAAAAAGAGLDYDRVIARILDAQG